jgi:hypothetical protein
MALSAGIGPTLPCESGEYLTTNFLFAAQASDKQPSLYPLMTPNLRLLVAGPWTYASSNFPTVAPPPKLSMWTASSCPSGERTRDASRLSEQPTKVITNTEHKEIDARNMVPVRENWARIAA